MRATPKRYAEEMIKTMTAVSVHCDDGFSEMSNERMLELLEMFASNIISDTIVYCTMRPSRN